jgi:pimeloyl-ACP methyl ester carboxylesterase
LVQKRPLLAQGFRSRVLEGGPEQGSSEEAVVFIHGAPGSADDWRPLLGMARKGRVLAFDLPGFGAASRPRGWDYSPDAFATFVAAALAELGVSRAHLVVSDVGSAAGMHWAAAHPRQFASAVLIDGGVLIGYRWHLIARLHRTPGVGSLVAAGGKVGLRATMRLYGNRLPKETTSRWLEGFDWGARRALLRFYRAAPAADSQRLAPVLARLDRPALVLWGERDRFVSCEQAERQLESFPSAEVEVLPGVAHYGQIEAPGAIAARLFPFLERQLARSVAGPS